MFRVYLISIFTTVILIFFGQACSQNNFEVDFNSSSMCENCNRAILVGNDPLLKNQWHLNNTGVEGGTPGADLNIKPVWSSGNYGDGVVVAVVDDGIDMNHPDLFQNESGLSWNLSFPTKRNDTSYPPGDGHGTCAAGIIAARNGNASGGSGVAPHAKIAAIGKSNALMSSSIIANAASATLNGATQISQIDVSSNSYGPPDFLGTYTPAEANWMSAIDYGLNSGRQGLGTVYVWAAGNGNYSKGSQTEESDRSNYDGYASYYGVMSICAVDYNGVKSYYSEPGSNLWVCSYSSDGVTSGAGITTTDLVGSAGFNSGADKNDYSDLDYTNSFGGTSAAAPGAAGVVALMVSEANKLNKKLSWRDFKSIIAKTAKVNDATDSGWKKNGEGHSINDIYGFGIIDAAKAVSAIANWVPLNTFATIDFPKNGPQTINNGLIPISSDYSSGISSQITITATDVPSVTKIEYVDIFVNLTHANWSDLQMVVEHDGKNSSGVAYAGLGQSVLMVPHSCRSSQEAGSSACSGIDGSGSGVYNFRFGSSKHLDENPVGTWRLKVYDTNANNIGTKQGKLTSWSLRFYGSK